MADATERPVVSAEERQELIRKLAYRHYLKRGGTAGQDLHDWLAAEAEVDAMLGQASEVEKLARGAT